MYYQGCRIHSMYFYLEVHVFGAVLLLFAEKMKFLYFQVFFKEKSECT